MHFLHFLLSLTLLAISTGALQQPQPQKQVLISFPQDTPQSELNDYKSAISSAGGEILHEWETIKGFIVKASAEALNTIKTFSEKQEGAFKATIEDDGDVTTQG